MVSHTAPMPPLDDLRIVQERYWEQHGSYPPLDHPIGELRFKAPGFVVMGSLRAFANHPLPLTTKTVNGTWLWPVPSRVG